MIISGEAAGEISNWWLLGVKVLNIWPGHGSSLHWFSGKRLTLAFKHEHNLFTWEFPPPPTLPYPRVLNLPRTPQPSIQFSILHTFCVFSTLGDTSVSLQDEVIFLQSPKPHKIWPLHIQGPTGVALCQELLLGCRLSPYNELLLIICIILWTTTVIVNKLIWLVCGR